MVGMGADLIDHPVGQALFTKAEEILGWSVLQRCQGEEAELSRTLYTQPCLYVVSAILADLMLATGAQPDFVAGHSLGEYVALYAARVFDFESGLKLVQRRAELMDQAADGKMVALIGFDRSQLEAEVEQLSDVVIANDNNAGQVVISGRPVAVQVVVDRIKVKRAVALNVSGAFHSPLMAPAASEFQQVLDQVSFQEASVPVLSNVEPTPAIAPDILKQRLIQQMTGSVRWRETSLFFTSAGVERVIEIGPGKVLTGLIKRTCPEIELVNISNLAELPA
jgi:[acyl-carrier-protein] S-malonyltransferase